VKIEFYYECVYQFHKGGAEKRIYTYSRCLARDIETQIISMKWWQGGNNIIIDKIKFVGIIPLQNIYNKNGKRRIISGLLFGLKTFHHVLRSNADIIDFEVFPYFPIIFAKIACLLKKKKPVIIAHWCECFGKTAWKRYASSLWLLGLWLEKLVIWSGDIHIAISDFTKNRLLNYLGLKSDIINVIPPTGIDYDFISEIKTPLEKKYDLIYYGRLIAHKNVDKIIRALDRLKSAHNNLKLLIIGGGPSKKYLVDLVYHLELEKNILFCDFIDDYSDLICRLKDAKVLVAPSEREGFGISIIEANACGLPAIVMDYPDNASKELIIEGQNGYVCKDDDELLEKIQYLCCDGNYIKMSKISSEMAKKYDVILIENQIREIYLNISRNFLENSFQNNLSKCGK
jgi:L-malate glycosyltransferase